MALTRINNQSLTNVTSAGLPTLANDKLPTLDSDKLPAGTVLQAKSTLLTTTGSFNVTSGNQVSIPSCSVTITPTSSSSKFLIFARIFGEWSKAHGADVGVNIYRTGGGGNANVNSGATAGNRGTIMQALGIAYHDNGSSTPEHNTLFALDSPSTTSNVTYQIGIKNTHPTTTYTWYYNRTGNHTNAVNYEVGSTEIVVQEISG